MSTRAWTIVETAIGRVAIPSALPPGLALFSTTSDFPGRLDGAAAASVLGVMRELFAVEGSLATCQQVHGIEVVSVGGFAPGRWCEQSACDALVTRLRGVALAVKIADCLPVTIADTGAGIAAAIHSGWRGAAGKIVDATIGRLRRDDGFDPRRAHAFLGPSIRVCCFEVGEEVVDALRDSFEGIDAFVERARGAKPHVNLPGLTRRLLLDAGFESDSIDDSAICTRCEGSIFHSYRRDGATAGRNLSIVALI